MTLIHEATGPAPTMTGARRARIRIIEGDRWGSSGYYPRTVIERDGPTAWPIGTQIFLDHPGATESHDRPERSVRDLAGKITSTPVYENDGLYADATFNEIHGPLIAALHDNVGMSIRASATTSIGEREGRTGPIIESITDGVSVDVVTRPGAGGAIVQLLESIRQTQGEPMSQNTGGSTAVHNTEPAAESGDAVAAMSGTGEKPPVTAETVTREEFDKIVERVSKLEAANGKTPSESEKPATEAATALDHDKLAESVAKHLAESYAIKALDEGAGQPRGNGQTITESKPAPTEADILKTLTEGR